MLVSKFCVPQTSAHTVGHLVFGTYGFSVLSVLFTRLCPEVARRAMNALIKYGRNGGVHVCICYIGV